MKNYFIAFFWRIETITPRHYIKFTWKFPVKGSKLLG